MQSKKGQVTLFIIIAILIVGAVALFFTLRSEISTDEIVPIEVALIQSFVQECIEDVGKEVIYNVG